MLGAMEGGVMLVETFCSSRPQVGSGARILTAWSASQLSRDIRDTETRVTIRDRWNGRDVYSWGVTHCRPSQWAWSRAKHGKYVTCVSVC